jgi:hypothetical protein
MIMATSNEGNNIARQITAAMTRFVNENVARAMKKGRSSHWQASGNGPGKTALPRPGEKPG